MRKTSLFVTLLMVFLLLISCSMDVEEPVVEDVPPVEVPEVTKKDVADVKIKISSTTLSSRTILPDSLVKANWYEVTLKSLSDPSLIYTESVQVSEEEEAVVSFENVRIGTYSVSGEAYIKNGESTKVLVYKGEGTNNLLNMRKEILMYSLPRSAYRLSLSKQRELMVSKVDKNNE